MVIVRISELIDKVDPVEAVNRGCKRTIDGIYCGGAVVVPSGWYDPNELAEYLDSHGYVYKGEDKLFFIFWKDVGEVNGHHVVKEVMVEAVSGLLIIGVRLV